MSDRFWLIQRGMFRKNLDTATEFLGPGNDHLIDGDYMGSAEFEWGAIPKAFRRIMDNWDKYSMHVTDITTVCGVPLCLFCRDEFYDEIVKELRRYIADPYPLKERTNMPAHFRRGSDHRALETNFWWCIDIVRKDPEDWGRIGDWIAFIGATDRQNAMQRVLDNSFNDWWMKKTESERKELLKDAYRFP